MLVGLLGVLSACGGSHKPLTSDQVRSAFRAEGLVLHVVLDSRTLDEQQIARETRVTSSDVGATRAAKQELRVGLEAIRTRALAHPMIWLATTSRLSNMGTGAVAVVWGRTSNAQSQIAKAKPVFSRTTAGLVRVRNVVVVYPADLDAMTVARVKAAVKRLNNGG
jgi:hypothetical protein